MKNNKKRIFLIVFAFVFIALGCAWGFSFRNMTLDFVQISDTHITDRADTSYKALGSSKELLKDAIDQINNIKGLDFVMFTGDLVDSATEENFYEYYKLLTKLKYPSLNTFGNHDVVYGPMSKEEVLNTVRRYNPNYTFSDTYYAITPKTDYRIIVLDANPSDTTTANGYFPPEQLEFLDNELAQNQDKVVLIALHHPPVEPFASKEHSIINADEFIEILLKYKNPIVVISGHYHATKLYHWGNLVFVSTPAMVTYPMAFRHIKITNYKDRVQFNFEFIPTRLEDVKEKNRQSVISYSTLAGFEKDRNLSYTFKKRHPKSASYKRNKIKNAVKTARIKKSELKKLSQPQKEKVKKIKKEKVQKQKTQRKWFKKKELQQAS